MKTLFFLYKYLIIAILNGNSVVLIDLYYYGSIIRWWL